MPGGPYHPHGSPHLVAEPVVGIERTAVIGGGPVVAPIGNPMAGYVPRLPTIREEIVEVIEFDDDFDIWDAEEDIEIFMNAFVEGAFAINVDEELIGCLTNPEWFMRDLEQSFSTTTEYPGDFFANLMSVITFYGSY